MMSDINTEIHDALADYHMKTGNPPTNIYLGRSQMDRLIMWNKPMACFPATTVQGSYTLEFMGLTVFEVNTDDHCFVS